MKAHLTFSYNPDKPEEVERIENILKIDDVMSFLREFDEQVLRPVTKHGDPGGCSKREEAYEEIREAFYKRPKEYGISLYL